MQQAGGKGTYGYVALHTLAKDLARDLMAFSNQNELAAKIRAEVLQEAMRSLTSAVAYDLTRLRRNLNESIGGKAALNIDLQLRTFQSKIGQHAAEVEGRVSDILTNILAK